MNRFIHPSGARRHPLRRHTRARRNGFALMATLWLSMSITTVILAFALEARRDRLAVANLTESSQAVAAALGGVATVVSRLDQLSAGTAPVTSVVFDANDPWQKVDTLLTERVSINGLHYEVRVRDGDALLDINAATDDQWTSFLSALNVDYSTAQRIAAAIGDWRDQDDDPRTNGAERSDYVRAGRLVLPTNRNFRSVEELRDVLGMTPAIFHMIQPYLGVGTSDGRISVNTAPGPVLRMIRGMTDDNVVTILNVRGSGGRIQSISQLTQLTRNPALRGGNLTFTTQTIVIQSTGWAPGDHTSATFTEAVNRGSRQQPLSTVRWRRME